MNGRSRVTFLRRVFAEGLYGVVAGLGMAALLLVLGILVWPGMNVLYLLAIVAVIGAAVSLGVRWATKKQANRGDSDNAS